jgi:hypothetical protein
MTQPPPWASRSKLLGGTCLRLAFPTAPVVCSQASLSVLPSPAHYDSACSMYHIPKTLEARYPSRPKTHGQTYWRTVPFHLWLREAALMMLIEKTCSGSGFSWVLFTGP